MKTLYLHLGTHKTGTSAIQKFLAANKNILLDKGFYYPTEGSYYFTGEHSQSLLAHALIHQQPSYIPRHVRFQKESCISDIQRDIEKSTSPNVIISSEHFSTRYTKENMQELKEIFAPYFSLIKPIIYIRRQDLYIESGYNQCIKTGLVANSFREFAMNDTGGNYIELIEKIASVFGKSNLVIKPYEKQQLYESDVVADFLKILELDITHQKIEDQNQSVPAEVCELMRFFNQHLSSVEERVNFNRFLRISGINFDQTKYTMCSPELRQEILSWHRQGNAKIAREYLGRKDGILFLDPETTSLPLYSGLTAERMSEIYAQIWQFQLREYVKLKKAITPTAA